MGRGRGGGRRFRRGRSLDLAFGLAFGLGIGVGVGVGVGAGLGRCRYRYRCRNLWRGRRRRGLRRSRAGGRRHRGQAPPPPGRRLLGLPGSSHHHSPPAVAGRFDRKVAGGDRASARAIQACWIDVLVGAGAPPAPLHLFFTPERGRGEGGEGKLAGLDGRSVSIGVSREGVSGEESTGFAAEAAWHRVTCGILKKSELAKTVKPVNGQKFMSKHTD